jgi:hypothetical protein
VLPLTQEITDSQQEKPLVGQTLNTQCFSQEVLVVVPRLTQQELEVEVVTVSTVVVAEEEVSVVTQLQELVEEVVMD